MSIALLAGVSGRIAIGALGGASTADATVVPVLDHFNCYTAAAITTRALGVPFRSTPHSIELRNRYAPGGFSVGLRTLGMQCNPAQQIVRSGGRAATTSITNPFARLVCWSIPARALRLPPLLTLRNQFGKGVLRPIAARSLCLPSWKNGRTPTRFPTSKAPSNLDPYVCYSATHPAGQPSFSALPSATLTDQFGTTLTNVGAPNIVCIPSATKTAAGAGWTAVRNPAAYSTCFALPNKVATRTAYDKNTFGTGAVLLTREAELCVPSLNATSTTTTSSSSSSSTSSTSTTSSSTSSTTLVASGGGAPALSVVGNQLVTAAGVPVVLRGVNRPGPEYAAAEGWGIFDGPTDDNASITAIKSWNVNAVRVPLNEDSWLGINNTDPTYNGAPYRAAIIDYVQRLNTNGIIAIVNLHFSAPGTTVPDNQSPMADEDHSPAFWQSVASTFAPNHSVIFDLFNEPYPDNNQDSTAAWSCILNGGTCPGINYPTAGMQQLVNVVRATGATQPVMIAGPQYAGVLDQWTTYEPTDPLHQLIASIHIYGLPLDSPDRLPTTWDTDIAPVATKVPIIIGEFGDTDCTTNFSPPLMTWADTHNISYLAWGWITANCANEPALITDYNGTPTPYGQGVRNHLLTLPNQW